MKQLKRSLQQMLRTLHLWLGLIAGLFIVVMGISGVIVVFRPYIEGAAAPTVSGGAVNLAVVEAGLGAELTLLHTQARVTRIVFPESRTEPLLVQAETADKQRMQFFVDPASGTSLGAKPKIAWLDWTVNLHQNLLAGKTGRAVTGVIGAALFLMSVTGLISWLTGRRDWKRNLAVPQKAPFRRMNYEGHIWAGLWTNLLLAVISFTGIMLAYPNAFEQGVRMMSGEPEPAARPTLSPGVHMLRPWTEYAQAAVLALPGGVVRELRLPNNNRAPVSLTVWTPGDARPKGTNVVYLDPSTASVLAVEPSGALLSSKRIGDFADAIHKTELGGLPVRIVFAIIGIASVLLCFSGVQIWWHRRQTAIRSARVRDNRDNPVGVLVHK
jgi:uncharacterized iron-regulated membrane protein